MQESIAAARVGDLRRNADGTALLEFRFNPEDPTFAGHFPGRPLLPGVYQLEMTRSAAELALKSAVVVREIIKAKFSRPIIPAELIRVELKLSDKPPIVQVRAGFSVNGQPAGEVLMHVAKNP
jgi:3-hydroxymyristoyl/3-hydroxydecanoyl-(acyl carrier protein) dehydratase